MQGRSRFMPSTLAFLRASVCVCVCRINLAFSSDIIISVSSSLLLALPELDSSGFVRERVHSFHRRSLRFGVLYFFLFSVGLKVNSIRTSIMARLCPSLCLCMCFCPLLIPAAHCIVYLSINSFCLRPITIVNIRIWRHLIHHHHTKNEFNTNQATQIMS